MCKKSGKNRKGNDEKGGDKQKKQNSKSISEKQDQFQFVSAWLWYLTCLNICNKHEKWCSLLNSCKQICRVENAAFYGRQQAALNLATPLGDCNSSRAVLPSSCHKFTVKLAGHRHKQVDMVVDHSRHSALSTVASIMKLNLTVCQRCFPGLAPEIFRNILKTPKSV